MTPAGKHRIGNWVAGVFAGALVLMVAAGGLYLSISSQMAAYDDYLACNPGTGLSRLEWLLGYRPFEDCVPQANGPINAPKN